MEVIRSGEYSIRRARKNEWEEAMRLAWETFLTFQTKEYSEEGIESFRDFVSDQKLKNFFLDGRYQMFLAFCHEKIIGLITLRSGCHISLLFVDKDYQRKGVGSALVEYLSDYLFYEKRIDYITVDAAPSAIDFYHKIGFWDLCPIQYRQGISYQSMKKNLNT